MASMSVPAQTPQPVAKFCTICGTDVSQRKRQKDQSGRYYCEPCVQTLARQREDKLPEATPADDAPYLLFCEKCGGRYPQDELKLDSEGQVLCTSCTRTAVAERLTRPITKAFGFLDVSHLPLREQYKKVGSRYRMFGVILQVALPVLMLAAAMNAPIDSWAGSDSGGMTILALMGVSAIVGGIMIFIGLGYYAMAKGHSRKWCWAGLLGIVGILILWILPDHWAEPRRQPAQRGC